MKGEPGLEGAQLGLAARVSQRPEVTGAYREPHRAAGVCQVQDRSALESTVKLNVTSLSLPPKECLSPIWVPWAWGRGGRVGER